ncbi:Hint domain-containing protein [Bdellovibrionota bacterium FG-2]
MKTSNSIQSYGLITALLLMGALSSTFAGADTAKDRCADDQLTTVEMALERNLWAAKCGYFGADPEAANNLATTFALTLGVYQVFSGRSAPEVPVDRNASCEGKTGFARLGLCYPGCYTPNMQLSFNGKSIGIEDSFNQNEPTVTTLTADSTLGLFEFKESKIEHYIAGMTHEMIFVIETEKGRRLEVTSEHPLVNAIGNIVRAKELEIGAALLDATNSIDLVTSVLQAEYQGKVWNLSPESENKTENVLVVNGLLTGSHRFQAQWASEKYRVLLRLVLDVNGL